MNKHVMNAKKQLVLIMALLFSMVSLKAQTEVDGIMMTKNNFCSGLIYNSGSWKNYWEGTLKRDNENIGTFSTKMLAVMGNYGITDKLNVLFNLPYIQNKISAGTLHGLQGLQDLSLSVKWMPIEKKIGKADFSLYGVAGFSFPVSNYVIDYLPLAIGLGTKNITARIIADYQLGNFFVTGSGSYVWRSNITLDRQAYYTTGIHLTEVVEMPNVTTFNLKTGYRSDRWIAEAVVNNFTTLGGYDIERNGAPFPSNRFNATYIGADLKYTLNSIAGLSFIGGCNYTIAGRNVGVATNVYGGIFYVVDFSRKQKHSTPSANTK